MTEAQGKSSGDEPKPPPMAAPSIPNLLSMRGSGGLRGGRGRSRRGNPMSRDSPLSSTPSRDMAVRDTDTDASVSRFSAVELGYLDDPYARFFVDNSDGSVPRRLPIINRGTYTRTAALDALVEAFLSHSSGPLSEGKPKQIISLGAGTDTRPFRLFTQQHREKLIYHELDFPATCRLKAQTIHTRPALQNVIALAHQSDNEATHYHGQATNGGEYYMHGLDLRQLSPDSPVEILRGLDLSAPTLILSECCLCYLSQAQASAILQSFTAKLANACIAIYEPMHPDDAFGKTMVSNLAARGIHMPTLDVYRDGPSQVMRLMKAGFTEARQMSVKDIWESWISPEEKERVDGCEGLDEVEEWKLLAGHYVVVWGSRGEKLGDWASKLTAS